MSIHTALFVIFNFDFLRKFDYNYIKIQMNYEVPDVR